MATYKGPPKDQAAHSRNGNGVLSPEPPVKVHEISNNPELPGEDGGRIPATPTATMDLKKATTREVLDYFLRSNHPAAATEFRDRVRSTIRGRLAIVLKRWANDDRLSDLEQETYIKLFKNDSRVLRGFTWVDDNSIFKYVRVAAAGVAVDWLRRRQNTTETEDVEEAGSHLAARQESPDHKIRLEEIDKCLRTLKCENPERDCAIFWLYYRYGHTAKEIANLPSVQLREKQVENILQSLVYGVRKKLDNQRRKNASPEK